MKTTRVLFSSVAVVVTLLTNQSLRADNLAAAAASASATVHRLVLASPHGLEEFPWLLREPVRPTDTAARSKTILTEIKKNRALAASPRIREQFPELARAEWTSTVAPSQPCVGGTALQQVLKNRALAASPRMKEQFPELARGYVPQPAEESVQVAPLK